MCWEFLFKERRRHAATFVQSYWSNSEVVFLPISESVTLWEVFSLTHYFMCNFFSDLNSRVLQLVKQVYYTKALWKEQHTIPQTYAHRQQ